MATVRVTNTVDGDEVVQLYISVPESKGVERPRSSLGFKRVTVPAGGELTCRSRYGARTAYYDEERGWSWSPGGTSSSWATSRWTRGAAGGFRWRRDRTLHR